MKLVFLWLAVMTLFSGRSPSIFPCSQSANSAFRLLLEGVIAFNPLLRERVGLSLHLLCSERQLFGNGNMQVRENLARCRFVVQRQFLVKDAVRLYGRFLEILLPCLFMLLNALYQVIDGREMEV